MSYGECFVERLGALGETLNAKAKGNARADRLRRTPALADETLVNDALETFGEALPGLLLESVVDPDHPGHLLLHTWNGHRTTTARKIEHGGVAYIPKNLGSGLVQSVCFALPSLPFGTPAKLISSMRDFLSTYARLQPEVADLLVAFGLATWFCDVMTVAPVLYLLGPDSAVSQALRLLGCFCRRPILLGDIDFAGLATLPRRLGATLLINQRYLGRRVQRTLLASNRRHFGLVHGSERLDLFGGKAFSCEDFPGVESGLRVSLSPTPGPLPTLSDAQEQLIARNLQARLLRYRIANYDKVPGRKIDASAFVPEMREPASTWLAPIVDCPELSESVHAEILRQSQEAAGARFFDPKCVVVEAALFFCHDPDPAHFFVGELAEKVNDLLKGRHEESNLSDKKAGLVLRELGVYGERVATGYKIVVTDALREQIHQLAFAYQVPPAVDGVRRCRYCRVFQVLPEVG
jgi:hypothetical protein